MTKNQPIIVKRVKKSHGGHHGGAWKVAYADFVTAMMAFFLLMWLITQVPDETKQALAYYFSTGTVMDVQGAGGETFLQGGDDLTNAEGRTMFVGFDGSNEKPYLLDEPQLKYFADREQELFDRAKIALEEALRSDPDLFELINNLIINQTPEGLNIQLIDQESHQLFASGSDNLTKNGERLTVLLAKVIKQMPQKIAIEGHTDAVPFSKADGYSNWELSTDRALAFRRRLLSLNLNKNQIVRVAGCASEQPYLPENPEAPQNRRISITLLSDYTEEALKEAKEKAQRQLMREKAENTPVSTNHVAK